MADEYTWAPDWSRPDMTAAHLLTRVTAPDPLLASYMGRPGVITGSDPVPRRSDPGDPVKSDTARESLLQKIIGLPADAARWGFRAGSAPFPEPRDAWADLMRTGLLTLAGIMILGIGLFALVRGDTTITVEKP